VRLHVLARTFAEKQLKLVSFSQLKIQAHERKRKRINILRSYYKAWQESNRYRQYMIDQNLGVLMFRRQCNISLLKLCFDALRHEKETEKHMLMTQALESETVPAIDVLNAQIAKKEAAETRSMQKRGLTVMQKMLRVYLGTYFYRWHDHKETAKFGVNVHLKQIILRAYKTRLSTAFATWKKGKQHSEITEKMFQMEEQGEFQS
jgi:hypothetical protein